MYYTTKLPQKCKQCGENYLIRLRYRGIGKCKNCIYKNFSEKRIEKNNPNYKDGHSTQKNFGGKINIYTAKHFAACKKYRDYFVKEKGYPFCEVCLVNKNGTPHFEVHHIYYASRYPKHKNLHNFNNLIHLCKQCHVNFHQGKYKEKFNQLEKDRGLKEMFKS